MSSRLPYSSQEFYQASLSPQDLQNWEKRAYQKAKTRVKGGGSANDLLAAVELAMRCQDAAGSTQLLETTLKRFPLEADAHYLKAMYLLGQSDPAHKTAALEHLQSCTPSLKQANPEHARVHRLLAEQVLEQQHDTLAAARHLAKAYDLAGRVNFVHCTTQDLERLKATQLLFDLEVFDALWPWASAPAEVRFGAVATDAHNRVQVLEQKHRWLFQFDAQGHFLRGLSEHDLAAAPFIYPELGWDLTDCTVTADGQYAVAGSADRIYLFDENWQQQRFLAPPAAGRTLRPLSLTSDSEGNLFVVYLHLGGIHWFNPEGFHMGAFGQNTIMPSLGKNYYCGLAVTPQQQVCLYDRESLQLYLPGQPQPLQTWFLADAPAERMENADYPFCWNGVACAEQSIYACDTYGNAVIVLDLQSGAFRHLETETLRQPFDVALDSRGQLYLADTGNARILKHQDNNWVTLLSHPSFQGAV